MLDCMVEGFHIITLQGEQGLRGVHMNLEADEKKILSIPWQMPRTQAMRDTKEKGGELSEVGEQAKSWEARPGRRVEETHASWADGHTFIPLPRLSKSL